MNKLKNYFLAGLLIWLPIGLTIWIINILINIFDKFIPDNLIANLLRIHIPGVGFITALMIVLITGIITRNILGQKLFSFWNKIFLKIPLVKSIYKSIKQVSDTLLSNQGKAFRKAILIKFPNNDSSWTIAFITGAPTEHIINNSDEFINVYVPTTPNPTSGYFLLVKKTDTKELNMNVDAALRYVISMGSVDIED